MEEEVVTVRIAVQCRLQSTMNEQKCVSSFFVLLERQRSMKQGRERKWSKGLSCDWWRGCLWALRVQKGWGVRERKLGNDQIESDTIFLAWVLSKRMKRSTHVGKWVILMEAMNN